MAQIADLISNNKSLEQLKISLEHEVDKQVIENNYVKGLANELKKTFGSAVNSNGNYIGITYRILQDASNNSIGFYDLKTAFARSPKAKTSKSGGWYLVIPIKNKAKQLRSAYGSNLWNTISHTEFGTTSGQQANIARFQKILMNSDMSNSPLAYQWKSANVTRVQMGNSATRGQYINFRTVSDKSDPNSWLISRDSMEQAINQNTNSEAEAQQVAKIVSSAVQKAIEEYNRGDNS